MNIGKMPLPVAPIHDVLPSELFYEIFDALRGIDEHKNALFASSLVSRAWRDTTLGHRFHSLSFYMVRTFRSQQPPSDQLLEFIKSDVFCYTRHHVRCLNLRWRGIRIDPHFARFINDFPSLHTLELKGHISSPADISVHYEPIIPNIRVLTVHGQLPLAGGRSRRHFSSSLCEILCQFASLEELRLLYIGGVSQEGASNPHNRQLPEIDTLVLRCIGIEDPVAGVIHQLAGQRPLRRLDLLEYTGEDLQDTLNIVKLFKAAPEHIRFSLTCWGKEMSVDLGYLPGMKRLTIAIEISPHEATSFARHCGINNNTPWQEANQSLATLDTRCRLESIGIYIGPADSEVEGLFLPLMRAALDELDATVLCAFENTLLRLHTEGRLGHVAISLYREVPTEIGLDPRFVFPATDYLRTLLPRLDQTGILRV